ncbi:MAG: putative sugar nucleotidyl transferase [Candidatus Eisenbacteria bacterium]|nr:putative sugar nucleotidyl transferase [Candidatus Eisenbacteria bacterium]
MMLPAICIFEDERFSQFYPLSLTRPVYELHCGIISLREKIEKRLPSLRVCLHARPYLSQVLSSATPNPVNKFQKLKGSELILVNGRILADDSLPALIERASKGEVFESEGSIVLGRIDGEKIQTVIEEDGGYFSGKKFLAKYSGRKATRFPGIVVNFLWDLIVKNSSEISKDFEFLISPSSRPRGALDEIFHCDKEILVTNGEHTLDPSAILLGKVGREQIFIGKGARIDPSVVLDARQGPIWIGEDAVVTPFTRVEGPACALDGTVLTGGKIREGTSIGPSCRVGGEVEETIFQGYSNKYHEGFLGHSYVGEWVNLGAMTTNSDLKNNYGAVKVWIDGAQIDTGVSKVGCFIGDHAKTGIGTLINTGTVIGVGSNIFGGGTMPPKYVPSFFWGGGEESSSYELGKFLETAKVAMSRRDVKMSGPYTKMLENVHELTMKERKAFGLALSSPSVPSSPTFRTRKDRKKKT